MRRRARRWVEWAISAPSFVWLLVFFLLPTLIVLAIAFKPSDAYGNIGAGWTLATLRSLSNPNYPAIVWRTVWLSVATTAVCLLVAVPFAYHMARVRERWRAVLMLLVMIPFWTSFLVRIFAWKVLLHPEGWLHTAAVALGLLGSSELLLYRPGAVLMVLVYSYLPFAILPVYAAAEKFDFTLIEAALDLGCRRLEAYWRIFVPGIRRGLVTAGLVVFIPALGSYVIPDIVGGNSSEMLGNKIAQRTFVDRNLPHAAALACMLTLSVVAPMIVVLRFQRRQLHAETAAREGRS